MGSTLCINDQETPCPQRHMRLEIYREFNRQTSWKTKKELEE